MKRVLLRAPVLTLSGYGTHSRQVFRYLLERERKGDIKLDVQALPWGVTPWVVNKDGCEGLAGDIFERCGELKRPYDVTLQMQLPNEWDPSLGTKNVGLTASVETDRCNPSWVSACDRMDLIVFPSEHARSAITNTGAVSSRTCVVPEAFFDSCATQPAENPFEFETKFNFLLFGQLTGSTPETDRKNVFNTIRWLCDAFKDKEDVGIVIKTNSGRDSLIDRNNTVQLLTSVIKSINPRRKPRVMLLHGNMADAELVALYKHPTVKALLTLTRGEGFGLPILEAAACGLPVIAPKWSGHTEFLRLGKFIDVEHHLVEIPKQRVDENIFVPGSKWAEADERSFKQRVQKFYTSPTTPQEWAKDLQTKILASYDFKTISKAYDAALEDIL